MTLTRIEQLEQLLQGMVVPEARRVVTPPNVRWLLRNLMIRNGDHEHIEQAVELLKALVSRRTQW
jgi:hypothetical protein